MASSADTDLRAKVRTFLVEATKESELADDVDIFAAGFVNSLFALQLVRFVEREFSIKVENAELSMANFNSVGAISAYVAGKRPGEGG